MRHGVREAAVAAKKRETLQKRETLPVDTATMMNVFNGTVKKMKDGGGVSFDFDLTQGDEEVLPTTLKRRDNEDEDEE
jgi:hypothetical protein